MGTKGIEDVQALSDHHFDGQVGVILASSNMDGVPIQERDKAELRRTERKFPVMELFGPTIQGEGAMIGVQTFFVRFGGCDFRCKQCDSMHAVLPQAVHKHATFMHALDIVGKLTEMASTNGVKWVTLSGGNPAIWDLSYLVECLKEAGFKIAVETQGTVYNTWLSKVDQLTVSPKGPGMGERFDPDAFLHFLEQVGDNATEGEGDICFKVVCFDQRDLEFAKELERLLLSATEEGDDTGLDDSLFLSLGNPWPPQLDDTYEPITKWTLNEPQSEVMMKLYTTLGEDILQDPDLSNWKWLPQLHVLAWGSEKGR